MVSEYEEIKHPDNWAFSVRIIDSIKLNLHKNKYTYNVKYFDFNDTLIFESLLVFDDLDCCHFFRLMAYALNNLPKSTFP